MFAYAIPTMMNVSEIEVIQISGSGSTSSTSSKGEGGDDTNNYGAIIFSSIVLPLILVCGCCIVCWFRKHWEEVKEKCPIIYYILMFLFYVFYFLFLLLVLIRYLIDWCDKNVQDCSEYFKAFPSISVTNAPIQTSTGAATTTEPPQIKSTNDGPFRDWKPPDKVTETTNNYFGVAAWEKGCYQETIKVTTHYE